MRSNREARLPVLAARQDLTDDHRSGSTSSSCAAAWISCARMDVPAAPRTLMAVSSTGLGPGGTGRARAGATLARATNRAWRAAAFLSFAGSSWCESDSFSSTKKCDFAGTFKTWFSPLRKGPENGVLDLMCFLHSTAKAASIGVLWGWRSPLRVSRCLARVSPMSPV